MQTNSSATLSHRIRTNEYGSGCEVEITAYAERIDDELLDELELDRSRPWAIRLSGVEYIYGPDAEVNAARAAEWEPGGEWQYNMTAEQPSEADCRSVAEDILDSWRIAREQEAED